ncbi:hypothetical protein Q3G72_002425 [Acer saccharum]|nr:hypothetical protein Q3G72_002425 [Acer saccharum]
MRSLMAVETLAMAFSGEKMALFCSRPSHKLAVMVSFAFVGIASEIVDHDSSVVVVIDDSVEEICIG